MPFRRCKARMVGRNLVPIAYWEIGPTTQRKSAVLWCTSHLAATCNAQYGKRQRFGTMALGHRTYLRVVEPVPSSSPAVREKSRYAQGAFIARVRSDLLEFPTGSLSVIRAFQTDKQQMR